MDKISKEDKELLYLMNLKEGFEQAVHEEENAIYNLEYIIKRLDKVRPWDYLTLEGLHE